MPAQGENELDVDDADLRDAVLHFPVGLTAWPRYRSLVSPSCDSRPATDLQETRYRDRGLV